MSLNLKKVLKVILIISVATIFLAIGLASVNTNAPVILGDKIGLININNVIGGESSSSIFEASRPSFLVQLRSAAKDPEIKALVLRIDSPGGSAGTSQELYQTVLRISEKGIPVVVSMGDIAASGGYYVAAGADYIFANGATITGSIGVIMEFVNFQELYDKIGVEFEVVKSGEFKDSGNANRSLTARELELYSDLIYDTWDQFVSDIVTARGLDREAVEAIADGRILSGRQALEVGLIDELGGLDEAIEKAKELANIQGAAEIKEYLDKPHFLDRLIQLINPLKEPAVQLKYQQK